MQDVYIRGMFRYLVQQFLNSMENLQSSTNSVKLTMMIVSILIIVSLYLTVWVPALNKLSKEVHRVRAMVLMIPLDVCAELKSIR